jgi:hypothetical protein
MDSMISSDIKVGDLPSPESVQKHHFRNVLDGLVFRVARSHLLQRLLCLKNRFFSILHLGV